MATAVAPGHGDDVASREGGKEGGGNTGSLCGFPAILRRPIRSFGG